MLDVYVPQAHVGSIFCHDKYAWLTHFRGLKSHQILKEIYLMIIFLSVYAWVAPLYLYP